MSLVVERTFINLVSGTTQRAFLWYDTRFLQCWGNIWLDFNWMLVNGSTCFRLVVRFGIDGECRSRIVGTQLIDSFHVIRFTHLFGKPNSFTSSFLGTSLNAHAVCWACWRSLRCKETQLSPKGRNQLLRKLRGRLHFVFFERVALPVPTGLVLGWHVNTE